MALSAFASLGDPTGNEVAQQQLSAAIWDDSSDDTDCCSSETDPTIPVPVEGPKSESSSGSIEQETKAPLKRSRFEYLLRDIAHIITCLYELSITIQNPAARDKLHKYKDINVKHFEHFELLHARDKFPNAARFLVDRLAKANVRRRQMFEYHHRHHQKIISASKKKRQGQSEALNTVPEESTSPQYPLPSTDDKLASNDVPDEFEILREAPPPSVQYSQTTPTTVNSYTTISAYIEPLQEAGPVAPEIEFQSEAGSQTSFASSSGGMGRLYIPSPPGNIELTGIPFPCPYCYYIIRPKDTFSWM